MTTGILQTARKVLEVSMGIKPGESILIVTDTATSPLIAKSFFDAASTIGCEVMLIEMLPRARSGIEPPRAIAEAMKNVDVYGFNNIHPACFDSRIYSSQYRYCKRNECRIIK